MDLLIIRLIKFMFRDFLSCLIYYFDKACMEKVPETIFPGNFFCDLIVIPNRTNENTF